MVATELGLELSKRGHEIHFITYSQPVRLELLSNNVHFHEELDHIFDPFFTTRRDAGGTGMGLPIVRRMLEAQGASIRLLDVPGAVFQISFDR